MESHLTYPWRVLQSRCLGFGIDRGIDRFPGSDSALLSRKDVVGLICTVAVGFTGSGIHFDLADL